MGEPLYNRPLRALDFRLLFWLLQHQEYREGQPTGFIARTTPSWRVRATEELNTHRQLLTKAEARLRAAGVITSIPHHREVQINPEAFL